MPTITYEEWLKLSNKERLKHLTEDADKRIRRWFFERMPPKGIQIDE